MQKLNLSDVEKIPLEKSDFVRNFGKTLIVAPHPDDESLGCGGACALLRNYKIEVSILILSDGTLSHPNSRKFPKDKLRDLREKELAEAAKILGAENDKVSFFRFRDRGVPAPDSDDFGAAVEKIKTFLDAENPATIFVPWRRDPHPDHRAAFQLIKAAQSEAQQIIEYPIWLYELATSDDAPLESEVSAFRLDIASVIEQKRRAILAHRSQTTDLIDDDAQGFRLSPQVLQNFLLPFEIYFQSR